MRSTPCTPPTGCRTAPSWPPGRVGDRAGRWSADLRGAIGFSSFTVLTYYAIANASAWTLPGRRRRRALPALGLAGCVVLACTLPAGSVVAGAAVLAAGAAVWAIRRLTAGPDEQGPARVRTGRRRLAGPGGR